MSKHTPGPWMFGIADYPVTEVAVSSERAPLARMVLHRNVGVDEAFANQRLMSAAPELLDALCRMVDLYENGATKHGLVGPALKAACDAIAKATGE